MEPKVFVSEKSRFAIILVHSFLFSSPYLFNQQVVVVQMLETDIWTRPVFRQLKCNLTSLRSTDKQFAPDREFRLFQFGIMTCFILIERTINVLRRRFEYFIGLL